MSDRRASEAKEQAGAWVSEFDAALAKRDEDALASLFETDGYWRNLTGISWSLATYSGDGTIARELARRSGEVEARGFVLDCDLLAPRRNVVAERQVVEAAIRFETSHGPGFGIVRLATSGKAGARPRAWTLSTALDIDRICERRAKDMDPGSLMRDFSAPTWRERRESENSFDGKDPDVLVVGGGHAGVTAAVELKRLGHDVLVIDRLPRAGDNWRLRYDGLRLHNTFPVNHFRYLPFPKTLPPYLSKDQMANWIEFYVAIMELNFWTGTTFEGGERDASTGRWRARVTRRDGSRRELHPKHIVMATSVSGTPNIPSIPTIEEFSGEVMHSSTFQDGSGWAGRDVVVFGTGTSAHDICQELHARDARVTMVQRSPTLIVNIEPSAQKYDSIYLGDGLPLEVRDLLNSSIPYPVVRKVHQGITREVKELDAPLLDRLEAVGFKLDFGEDETGWPFKFRTRGGGYYFNVGCSDLIAERKIGLVQASDIDRFVPEGIRMKGGDMLKADAIILATGFKGHSQMVLDLFGEDVLERVGPIWGFDPVYHELRNMWVKTGQPGLWFTGGAFSMSRIYSRFLALQIDAIESGRLENGGEEVVHGSGGLMPALSA